MYKRQNQSWRRLGPDFLVPANEMMTHQQSHLAELFPRWLTSNLFRSGETCTAKSLGYQDIRISEYCCQRYCYSRQISGISGYQNIRILLSEILLLTPIKICKFWSPARYSYIVIANSLGYQNISIAGQLVSLLLFMQYKLDAVLVEVGNVECSISRSWKCRKSITPIVLVLRKVVFLGKGW